MIIYFTRSFNPMSNPRPLHDDFKLGAPIRGLALLLKETQESTLGEMCVHANTYVYTPKL